MGDVIVSAGDKALKTLSKVHPSLGGGYLSVSTSSRKLGLIHLGAKVITLTKVRIYIPRTVREMFSPAVFLLQPRVSLEQ